jgi:Flp pilus assembly protein TadG
MIRLLRSRAGSSALEFALLAPALVALMLGIADAGRFYWARNAMEFASEEAVRYAMANPDASSSELTSYALARVSGVAASAVNATAVRDTMNGTQFVTVQLSAPFTFLTPIPSTTISASARVPLV